MYLYDNLSSPPTKNLQRLYLGIPLELNVAIATNKLR
jgi:hypothetical protein